MVRPIGYKRVVALRSVFWGWGIAGVLLFMMVVISRGQTPEESAVDPDAQELIQAMCDHFKSNHNFRFRVVDTIDEVRDSGQKIQFSHVRTASISRPDRLRLESVGDINNRLLVKDGETVTLMDKDHNVYGQIQFQGNIDEMMDRMLARFGVSMPLADLLSGDPYEVLMGDVLSGEYIGLHMVGDTECHHLAFTQETIDWQVWIDAGETPRMRKLLITYKSQPGEPQYTMTVHDVEQLAEFPSETFQFVIPEGCEKIEIQPMTSKSEPL